MPRVRWAYPHDECEGDYMISEHTGAIVTGAAAHAVVRSIALTLARAGQVALTTMFG